MNSNTPLSTLLPSDCQMVGILQTENNYPQRESVKAHKTISPSFVRNATYPCRYHLRPHPLLSLLFPLPKGIRGKECGFTFIYGCLCVCVCVHWCVCVLLDESVVRFRFYISPEGRIARYCITEVGGAAALSSAVGAHRLQQQQQLLQQAEAFAACERHTTGKACNHSHFFPVVVAVIFPAEPVIKSKAHSGLFRIPPPPTPQRLSDVLHLLHLSQSFGSNNRISKGNGGGNRVGEERL